MAENNQNDLEFKKLRRQVLDDTFDVFTMLAGGNIVSVMDVDGNETRYTPNAVDLFELSGEYIPNGSMNWSNWVHPDDRKHYEEVMGKLVSGESNFYDLSYRVRIKGGRYSLFRAVGGIIRGDSGKPSVIGGMLVNEGLVQNTDPITVMSNQYAFLNDLSAAMRGNRRTVLLLVSLDTLNHINDVYGYSTGNNVLQEAGMLLQELVGDRAKAYRMNGAKFAVLSDQMEPDEMAALYERLRRKLQSGLRVDRARLNLPCSGGVLTLENSSQMDVRTVVTSLSFAHNESRTRMHGDLVSFDSSHSLSLVEELRRCVIDGCRGFSLEYQPVISARTEKPIGVEAFVRWEHPEYGRLNSGQFIPILERDTVFEELGIWVLRQAMTDGKLFLEKDPGFVVGVNISAVQLEKDYFADTILQTVEETGFPAQNLCLEINRDCRELNMDLLRQVSQDLQDKGVLFSIDDFGTGSSSFEVLKTLNAEYAKLDASLTSSIAGNVADREALLHLSELAATYGSNVCVKCVESSEVLNVLKRYPVRSIQGYLFDPPLALDDILRKYFS